MSDMGNLIEPGDNDTAPDTDTEAPAERAFYPSDYRKMAAEIKALRMTNPEQADALVQAVSQVYAQDHAEFDQARFVRRTVDVPAHYGRVAHVIKASRHVKCQPSTPASASKLEAADALASAVAGVFHGEDNFDAEAFHKSTQLPEPSHSHYSDSGW